ncbi:hypothetical protein SIAM614_10258 [Stappia aggregata IAM 12614]|uniref:Uncharacterized protein n=1 Tax=Roseibium aggregatum (strain ATCC 25650 / DSM 13394 / JCM 20685 / NBRC 16684 / NCIMB 2208 / IAM 12614 / B1) TaxID=384765 RepID=A0NMA9_ROSAI|nr:hypothetical protein SIAM614_10258 [Stappia aggregata IAM 12614] [Roseibium aggregatum IAM 12614]
MSSRVLFAQECPEKTCAVEWRLIRLLMKAGRAEQSMALPLEGFAGWANR